MERIFAQQETDLTDTECKNRDTCNKLSNTRDSTLRSFFSDGLDLVFTDHSGEYDMHDEPCHGKGKPSSERNCENWGKVCLSIEVKALGVFCESLDSVKSDQQGVHQDKSEVVLHIIEISFLHGFLLLV